MSAACTNSGEDGFTLLETIIAFLILAISLGIAVETISSGVMTFRRASDLEQASQIMERLAAVEMRKLNAARVLEGKTDDGAGWKLTVRPIGGRRDRPFFAVTAEIRPRGGSGPVFEYLTFSGANGQP